MTKIVKFKFNHCCLCPYNEMRLKETQEFWCIIKERKLDDEEYADFPYWCPDPIIAAPKELVDLEKYLNERII